MATYFFWKLATYELGQSNGRLKVYQEDAEEKLNDAMDKEHKKVKKDESLAK